MTKLTDTQAILLTAAAARADRSLLPPPATLSAADDRVRKAVAALIKRELTREVEADGGIAIWREDGDLRFGVVITDAGLAAIGVEPEVLEPADAAMADSRADATDVAAAAPVAPAPDDAAPAPTRPASKIAQVLALLRRTEGATLAELVAATGWLPHTTRAALTGLRKQGHALGKRKRDAATCYHAVAGA